MGRIEKQTKIPSISVDESFLRELISIIKKFNSNKNLIFQISIYLEGETLTYETLDDFFDSGINSEEIVSFTIKADHRKKEDKKKYLRIYFKVFEDETNSFYNLLGYDEGALMHLDKQIKRLIKKHKTWYSPFHNFLGLFVLGVSASLAILSSKILQFFKISSDNSTLIAIVLFFIFANRLDKMNDYFFPFLDIELKQSKTKKFLRWFFGALSLGLFVNFLYTIIKLVIQNYLI